MTESKIATFKEWLFQRSPELKYNFHQGLSKTQQKKADWKRNNSKPNK